MPLSCRSIGDLSIYSSTVFTSPNLIPGLAEAVKDKGSTASSRCPCPSSSVGVTAPQLLVDESRGRWQEGWVVDTVGSVVDEISRRSAYLQSMSGVQEVVDAAGQYLVQQIPTAECPARLASRLVSRTWTWFRE